MLFEKCQNGGKVLLELSFAGTAGEVQILDRGAPDPSELHCAAAQLRQVHHAFGVIPAVADRGAFGVFQDLGRKLRQGDKECGKEKCKCVFQKRRPSLLSLPGVDF